MAAAPERPLDSSIVTDCHREFSQRLERYAWAIVRDWSLAADVVQTSFVALSRFGGDVAPEARKSWLFRVVHREALRVKEKQKRFSSTSIESEAVYEATATYAVNPLAKMADDENVENLNNEIGELPEEQQTVLRLRIYENMTFAEIAKSMNIPIGTALSRMRLALERLRAATRESDEES
ncbi:MAG: sigma-70 family RNA polymerase sigma factor [Pirellulaceae bacterium]|nr:sigma-70 family RNA polymerase sigma factor [Pirellulaceae bacterium]